MPERAALDVIVVDDNCRLAVHLWHYLARSPSFGIGDIRANDGEKPRFRSEGKAQHLPTPDGAFRVWWVEARGEGRTDDSEAPTDDPEAPTELVWQSGLEDVLEAIPEPRGKRSLHFLIDVRGPYKEHGPRRYSPQEVLAYIGQHVREPSCEKTLVSSYRRYLPTKSSHRPPGVLPVREKTPETFELIRRQGERQKSSSEPEDSVSPLHLLVTGAGFELRGKDEVRSLGHQATGALLKRALERVGLTTIRRAKKDSFPIPDVYQKYLPGRRDLFKAAKTGDLDAYWNQLLQLEAARISDGGGAEDPLEIALDEHRLRESFRSALLEHDWGHLRQALDAVDTPFRVWLTTNYSGFADRAIQLWTAHNPDAASEHPWRVISTSNEAIRHLRQLLHGKDPAKAVDGTASTRHLFKLHGDIAHLTTMALAGHDKELYTPLSLPIDSLHMVYMTAEQHLLRLLAADSGPVLWHVVGHGLQDRLLVRLMVRVISADDPTRHRVNVLEYTPGRKTFPPVRSEDPPPSHVLVDAFRSASKPPPRVDRAFGTAQDYMARLKAGDFVGCPRPRDESAAALLRNLAEVHGMRREMITRGPSRRR